MKKSVVFIISLMFILFLNELIAVSPPPCVEDIIISTTREILPNDNTTVCNITAIPIDENGEPIDTIVWFSSSLNGTYLNGERHPPGNELLLPTQYGKATVSLTADTIGNTTIRISCGGRYKTVTIKIVKAPGDPPPPPPTFSFDLKKGWNLILLPIKTPYHTAEELGQAIEGCDTICKLEENVWVCHPIGGPANFEIEDGKSYFVHVINDTVFTVYGLPYEVLYINLSAGINAIGWIKDSSITAEELGLNITNCTDISKWDAHQQKWITHPIGGPGNFVITKGMGLLAFVTSPSTWKYPT